MLCKQIPSFYNRLRHFIRYYSTGKSMEYREQWRTQVFNQLVLEYGKYNSIKKLFIKNPQFEQSDFNVWKDFITTLYLNGFEYQDCFKMVDRYPHVLGYPVENIEFSLKEWRNIFPSDQLKFLILNNPKYLDLDPKCVKYRGLSLLSYCLTKESLITMLILCPNLMYENWDEILKKMEFLNEEMVVYRTEVFQCKALSKSMHHLRLRFSILEKCGLYIRPSPVPYKQTKQERLKLNNPSLRDITDKSDISFAKKVAKISLEEYETFSDLFDKYENKSREIDSDMTSDEEDNN